MGVNAPLACPGYALDHISEKTTANRNRSFKAVHLTRFLKTQNPLPSVGKATFQLPPFSGTDTDVAAASSSNAGNGKLSLPREKKESALDSSVVPSHRIVTQSRA
jgi:hypothetical protein